MKRILAIDYGMRRIGLAVSDPLQIIATPLDTLRISNYDDGIKQLLAVYEEYKPATIIMGYPLGTSGDKTDQTRLVDKVINSLRSSIDVHIISWDERYTSLQAKSILLQQGRKVRDDKGMVDQLAARIMLQEYLDSQSKT
ncbi:MAG: Holliday junction resolvase RuvX [Candidatus Neomarinimicrobiota bacterium]|nr:Holliday junction resolvase RuvX [Candidatus Neomarinimicrobiota bacterium]RKY54908.1 MAG: Holliday junction resolvase RuvX [Candidatus Neomarinimicrobiota bacterium]